MLLHLAIAWRSTDTTCAPTMGSQLGSDQVLTFGPQPSALGPNFLLLPTAHSLQPSAYSP
jgi:hypothetical protein